MTSYWREIPWASAHCFTGWLKCREWISPQCTNKGLKLFTVKCNIVTLLRFLLPIICMTYYYICSSYLHAFILTYICTLLSSSYEQHQNLALPRTCSVRRLNPNFHPFRWNIYTVVKSFASHIHLTVLLFMATFKNVALLLFVGNKLSPQKYLNRTEPHLQNTNPFLLYLDPNQCCVIFL